MTTNSSAKILLTINRLRLCSKPALQSKSLKRIFCSSLRRKRILVTRSFGLLCSFLVSIHSFGLERRSTGENTQPRRASTFCMPKSFSAYKGTARCYLAITKIRGGKFFVKTLKTSATASEGGSFPVTILQPCGRQNKPSVRTGAVWGGHWFESVLPYCILRQE